jgi:hypothetical protein
MSVAHHTRSHAQWAASATARNVTCAGAIAMETMCEDKETEAAAWGTCAHQISERCLRNDYQADKYLDTVEKSGKFSFTVDEEMANCSQVYVDYCRDRLAEYRAATGQDAQFWIEQKLTLASLNPPLKAGGTGDFGMHFPRCRRQSCGQHAGAQLRNRLPAVAAKHLCRCDSLDDCPAACR